MDGSPPDAGPDAWSSQLVCDPMHHGADQASNCLLIALKMKPFCESRTEGYQNMDD